MLAAMAVTALITGNALPAHPESTTSTGLPSSVSIPAMPPIRCWAPCATVRSAHLSLPRLLRRLHWPTKHRVHRLLSWQLPYSRDQYLCGCLLRLCPQLLPRWEYLQAMPQCLRHLWRLPGLQLHHLYFREQVNHQLLSQRPHSLCCLLPSRHLRGWLLLLR